MRRSICLLLVVACAGCADIATPFSGSPSVTSPTPVGATESDLLFCLTETNRYRAMVNMPPLERSTPAETFAATAAAEDARTGTTHAYILSHPPDGGWGENQAISSGSVRGIINRALVIFWAEGPGGMHYDNMVAPYSQLGCGSYNDGTTIRIVQEFRK